MPTEELLLYLKQREFPKAIRYHQGFLPDELYLEDRRELLLLLGIWVKDHELLIRLRVPDDKLPVLVTGGDS